MSSRRSPKNIDDMVSLKIDNLNYNILPLELRTLFEGFGEIGDIHIPRDRVNHYSKGFGFVRFYDKKVAEVAMREMDGYILYGRKLKVQMALISRPDPQRRSRWSRSRSRDRHSRSRSSHRKRSRRYSSSASPKHHKK